MNTHDVRNILAASSVDEEHYFVRCGLCDQGGPGADPDCLYCQGDGVVDLRKITLDLCDANDRLAQEIEKLQQMTLPLAVGAKKEDLH